MVGWLGGRSVAFVFLQFLINHWLDFNEILWEASLPRGDVYVISLSWSNNFCPMLWVLGTVYTLFLCL